MRKLTTMLLTLGFALGMGFQAQAASLSLVNTAGGTADASCGNDLNQCSSNDGSAITLDIMLTINNPNDGALFNGVGVSADFNPAGAAAAFSSATEPNFTFIGANIILPLLPGVNSGLGGDPRLVGQWDLASPSGVAVPAGDTTFSLGTLTLQTSGGGSGFISIGLNNLVFDGITFDGQAGALDGAQYGIVPEPTTAGLMVLGLMGLAIAGRNRS